MLLIDHATPVAIRAQFAPLFGARHHMGAHLQPFGLLGQLGGQSFVLRRVVCRVKSPDLAEVAVNAFTAHKLGDPG